MQYGTLESPLASTDEQIVLFFQELKRDLHLDSVQHVVSLMRDVFARVSWCLAEEEKNRLTEVTPPLFHLLLGNAFAHGRAIQHLDELVDAVYEDNKRRKKRLFRTEIDAMRGVIAALQGIQKQFDRVGLQPFGYTLSCELRQAAEGNTAPGSQRDYSFG